MPPNIVLIGFMGCGKSSVGRRIAQSTGYRFVDTDERVTACAGKSIAKIFATHGEAHFRELEAEALRQMLDTPGIVLATGGGIVIRESNWEILRRIGPVAWLDADPDVLFERVSRNNKRPLLQSDNPRETFDTLLTARYSMYEAVADFRVDSTRLSHDDAARIVIEEARRVANQGPEGL